LWMSMHTTSALDESLKSEPDAAENESKELRKHKRQGSRRKPLYLRILQDGENEAFTHPLGIHMRDRWILRSSLLIAPRNSSGAAAWRMAGSVLNLP
jgi:hypothetical protein